MAFSWNTVTAGVTIAKADDINQVKNNTDTLADNLSLAHYSWSEMPVVAGDIIEAAQVTELQDALDYIDTNNVCSTDNASYFGTDNPAFDNTADLTQDATVDGTDNGAINTNVDNGVDGAFNSGVNVDRHYLYDNNVNTGVNPGHDASEVATNNSGYLNNHNSGYNGTRYVTVYSTRNSSAK